MRDWRAKLARRAKEGDDFLVTLFVPSVTVVLLAAVLMLTPRHGDSLIGLVPRSAVMYVHADGGGLDRLGGFLPSSLAATRPKEVVAFAQQDANGSLAWAWLLRWNSPVPTGLPCEATPNRHLCLIVANQAMRDKQTAAIRDASASLATDGPVAKSLAGVRQLSLVQAYVQPAGFRDLASEGVALPSRAVLTWDRHGRTMVWPVGNDIVTTGLAVSAPQLSPGLTLEIYGLSEGLVPAAERLVLSDASTAPRPLLAQLEVIFGRAKYLSVGDDSADFSLHLQGVSPQRLSENLRVYYSLNQPIRRPITMPDGQTVTELAIDDSWVVFEDDGEGKLRMMSKDASMTVPTLAIVPDDHGGTWLLGGKAARLNFSVPEESNSQQACFRSPSGSNQNPIDGFLVGSESTCFIENVDKSVIIYRYSPQ